MRKLHTDVKIAVANLKATRLRTALTILGVVIGISAVTTTLSLGEGIKSVIARQITNLGANQLTVRTGKLSVGANKSIDFDFLTAMSTSTITEEDLKSVQQTKGVEAAAPLALITGSIKSGNVAGRGQIIATTKDLAKVIDVKMHTGSFLEDNITAGSVVLGRDLAVELTGSDVSIGHMIKLRGQEFTITGIMQNFKESSAVNPLLDINRTAFVTIDTGRDFHANGLQIAQINARLGEKVDIGKVSKDVKQRLLENHSDEEDFSVLSPADSQKVTDNMFWVVSAMIGAVAAISIVVGGIGIMNIMLVSVTERTREIGIRKAVGATNHQILLQFLVEALIMSVAGGLLGLGLGYVMAFFIGTSFNILPVLTWWIVLMSLAISVGVGLIFGIWPGLRAAGKDPIEALRHYQ